MAKILALPCNHIIQSVILFLNLVFNMLLIVIHRFAAALRDLQIWVMNVVAVDSPDTLPIIYERGLFGIYHDWCESFNTYPRSYDLLHADHLFSKIKKKYVLILRVKLLIFPNYLTHCDYL